MRFSLDDKKNFRAWLKLDENSLTWEGKYRLEFESFWNFVIEDDIDILSGDINFKKILRSLSKGPAKGWLEWLQEQFWVYCFLTKPIDVDHISQSFHLPISEVLFALRKYYYSAYPEQFKLINELFQYEYDNADKKFWTHQILAKNFGFTKNIESYQVKDIRQSYEITLNKDWQNIRSKYLLANGEVADAITSAPKEDLKQLSKKFLRDVVAIAVLGCVVVGALEFSNRIYEKYLLEKIQLFEPNFFWLDKNVTFKTNDDFMQRSVSLSSNQIEQLEEVEKTIFEEKNVTSYEADPEVLLSSSSNSLFKAAETTLSDYEESDKNTVIRDRLYGFNKAYRILINSPDPNDLKGQINKVIEQYKISQVDKVKPGTEIPGGVYYNIFVPKENIDQFIQKVSGLEESNIYVSKTVLSNPAGMDRVFIWIKSI